MLNKETYKDQREDGGREARRDGEIRTIAVTSGRPGQTRRSLHIRSKFQGSLNPQGFHKGALKAQVEVQRRWRKTTQDQLQNTAMGKLHQ